MSVQKCPVCSSTHLILSVSQIEGLWNSPKKVAYCKNCGLYFLEQMPGEKELSDYYTNDYHDYSKIHFFFKKIFRNFRSQSQRSYLKKHLSLSEKRVIEVGAADGRLLSLLKRDKAEIFGTEFNTRMREFAMKKMGLDLKAVDFFEVNGEFDLLLMSHAFEHFTDLTAVLKKTSELLSEGGHLFFEVPNSPLPNEVHQNEIDDYVYTPHTYNFRLSSMETVLKNNGFEVSEISRYVPRVPFLFRLDSRKKMNEALLKGSLPPLLLLPHFGLYFLLSLLFPKFSYKKISSDLPWQGLSDNIRVIAKKK